MSLQPGYFGKLPAAGDFVQRRLPPVFVDAWDRAFSHALAGARDLLGDAWLQAYHAAPAWRFLLSPGIVGPAAQSLMTRKVAATEQGRLQGANTSLQALAGIVAPLLFGEAYSLAFAAWTHASPMGIAVLGAPYLLASLTMVTGAGLAIGVIRAQRTRA